MLQKFKKIHWTEHSKFKMKQYGLSKSKLINLIHKPERMELGIVPGTMALMQTNKMYSSFKKAILLKNSNKQKKAPGEIWLMYKDIKDLRKVISAWRYPGISKPGESIPIPDDIRQEILNHGIE